MFHLPGRTRALPSRGACQHNSRCHCALEPGSSQVQGPQGPRGLFPGASEGRGVPSGWTKAREPPGLGSPPRPLRGRPTPTCHGGGPRGPSSTLSGLSAGGDVCPPGGGLAGAAVLRTTPVTASQPPGPQTCTRGSLADVPQTETVPPRTVVPGARKYDCFS